MSSYLIQIRQVGGVLGDDFGIGGRKELRIKAQRIKEDMLLHPRVLMDNASDHTLSSHATIELTQVLGKAALWKPCDQIQHASPELVRLLCASAKPRHWSSLTQPIF